MAGNQDGAEEGEGGRILALSRVHQPKKTFTAYFIDTTPLHRMHSVKVIKT